MYLIHSYECCNHILGRVPRVKELKQRIEKGLDEHETDFNLEHLLIDFKTRQKKMVEEKLKKKMASLCKIGGHKHDHKHDHNHNHGDNHNHAIQQSGIFGSLLKPKVN